MNRLIVLLISGFILSGCQSQSAWSPSPDEPRAFVSTLGTDTVTVEVFTRSESLIEGVLVERSPYTYIIEYAARLDSSGNINRLEVNRRTPESNPDGPAPTRFVIELANGKADIVREGGQNEGTSTVEAADGTVPYLGRAAFSMFVFEQVAAQLRGGATGIELLRSNGSPPRINDARVISADTISMDYFGYPRVGWLDDEGQLLGVSGAATTGKTEARRVEPFLVGEMAERWAAMDARGAGIGTLSPGATSVATIDGVDFEVRYSQPAKRGRDIWGGLVPEGKVWRTGANAAVHFTTSRDITIGGEDLAAGTYTLFSIHSGGSLELIINAQTNQWGTQYDQTQDIMRLRMDKSDLADPQERFTISIEATDVGARLNFDWGETRFSVPVSPKSR